MPTHKDYERELRELREHRSSRRERSRSRSGGHRRRRHRSPTPDDSRRQHRDHPPPPAAGGGGASAAAAAAPAAAAALQLPPPPPLDKAARRALKREEEESGARVAALFGYTAENNPFGDPNVTQLFVWKKKIEKDVASGRAAAAPTREDALRQREALVAEVESAKERRAARDKAKEEMERLRAEEDRIRDAEQHAGWEQQEEQFHKRQAALRSLLRIREGRERPIDMVAKNLVLARALHVHHVEARGEAVEQGMGLEEPLALLEHLGQRDLGELVRDAQEMAALDRMDAEAAAAGGSNSSSGSSGGVPLAATHAAPSGPLPPPLTPTAGLAFWRELCTVAADMVRRLRQREASFSAHGSSGGGGGGGSSSAREALVAVEEQVDAQFSLKSEAELEEMERDVQERLRGGSSSSSSSSSSSAAPAVDYEYWEGVLCNLQAARARARLKRMHEEQLQVRVAQMEVRGKVQGGGSGAAGAGTGSSSSSSSSSAAAAQQQPAAADVGSYSPAYLDEEELAAAEAAGAGPKLAVLEPEEDKRRLLQQRIKVLRAMGLIAGGGGGGGQQLQGDAAAAAAAAAGDNPGERVDQMGAELEVAVRSSEGAGGGRGGKPPPLPLALSAQDALAFADKYRTRKPRYFNRVKTGYDWNKYNKAHYDKENPPPRTVQGYMFNIFYPDLIDRQRTPSFHLEPCLDSDDFVLIIFKGGPPYEPLAFKIVNKEWNSARKHGFRCTFDRGVLQLHFNFARAMYRS